ncbi:uncharacterized protein (DUF1697 family) [Ulvibacter sp. MAR_2010_11]|uniref:DUF1697 domain-containing protein n=1 Tax=Ulvibacter sp. MAR_2010_11 TaxID=1250229 RepID=UPI000C2B7D55|nr:DUF1697 domain-containing protein [Ulvibacter sp. MAR_2010_11]PKA82565.1 uncharacterized protein (DUF1697 family) [Ulvibacter sp. MAR_2010_11]
MKKYIALLRGINVSGHKKILMTDLKALFEALGFEKVQTYIQSGNVVFTSEKKVNLADIISEAIKKAYGWEVPVLVLTVSEIEAILAHCPFPMEKMEKSYFVLLAQPPLKEDIDATSSLYFPKEEFIITPQCVYLYTEIGAGNTKLSNNFFEKKLKVSATSRNYRTMAKLLSLISG